MKRKFGLSVVMAGLLVLAIALTASGCGASSASGADTSDYKSVVSSFMSAVDTQNTKKLLNCFQKDDREDILDDFDEKELKSMLEEYDADMTDEYGKNWCKDIELGKREKLEDNDDVVYYAIQLEIDGDEVETIPFIKVDDEYFIDPEAIDILPSGGGSSSGGKSGGPEQVVKNFFKSIDERDVDLFLSCFQDEFVEGLLENQTKEEMEEELAWIDESAEEEQGKNWVKQIKIGKAEEVDSEDGVTYYDVPVSFDDEEETITVIKIKSKYYLDDSELGELF